MAFHGDHPISTTSFTTNPTRRATIATTVPPLHTVSSTNPRSTFCCHYLQWCSIQSSVLHRQPVTLIDATSNRITSADQPANCINTAPNEQTVSGPGIQTTADLKRLFDQFLDEKQLLEEAHQELWKDNAATKQQLEKVLWQRQELIQSISQLREMIFDTRAQHDARTEDLQKMNRQLRKDIAALKMETANLRQKDIDTVNEAVQSKRADHSRNSSSAAEAKKDVRCTPEACHRSKPDLATSEESSAVSNSIKEAPASISGLLIPKRRPRLSRVRTTLIDSRKFHEWARSKCWVFMAIPEQINDTTRSAMHMSLLEQIKAMGLSSIISIRSPGNQYHAIRFQKSRLRNKGLAIKLRSKVFVFENFPMPL
ncbi:hypothetical protein BZA77DRAFT_291876 [Pyronema omphalodes]|nr:hypothetical protein BZA77DRAFT_296895 [Pyronema omphalodes]KAI5817947.1 hypothetical protein BZA77DRAFT_291876 [Pyronema omphalodes]